MEKTTIGRASRTRRAWAGSWRRSEEGVVARNVAAKGQRTPPRVDPDSTDHGQTSAQALANQRG